MCAARNFSSRLLPDENEVLKAFKHKAKQKKKSKGFLKVQAAGGKSLKKENFLRSFGNCLKLFFAFFTLSFLACFLHYVPFGLKASPSVACFPFKQQEKEKMYGCERMSTDSDIGIFNQ